MATFSEALAIAVQHHQAGRLEVAAEIYRRILAVEPNHPDALHLFGLVAHQVGKHEVAVEYIERAVRLRGTDSGFHNTLGSAYCLLGMMSEAVACFRRALEIGPDSVEVHYNLGNAFQYQGKPDEAVSCYRRALELKPDYFEAYYNLGITLKNLGRLDEAISCYRRALELKPDSAMSHNGLGDALQDQGRLDEAVSCYRRALELKPDFAEAHNNLGVASKDQGKLDEAVSCYRRALELKPDYAEAHSNLLCALQYRHGVTLAELAEAHQEFQRRHAAPLRTAWRPHDHVRDADRRLRLGFVSPDFRHHPVAYFLISVLENLDRRQCETICYNDATRPDDMTTRFRAAASAWRDTQGLADERLAEQIRADRIDILFDLAGHTANNRLLVFARKPAPIQITWIGYVGTTGLQAMDYILADKYEIPLDAEGYYCERVLCLPDDYVCYTPPDYAPPVGPLAALAAGHVTFASFNNPGKITANVVAAWAEVLARVPRSRLVLKYPGVDDAQVRHRCRDLCAKKGVSEERLELLGGSRHADHLASYGRVDIALDTFPYSGGLTTCEALWMGVPVITVPGQTFASRHGLTHLTNVGLTETIARDRNEYVELTVTLASDLGRLAEMRARLREQMARSPLCDGKRFAANLLSLLREVWRKWMSGV